MPIKFKTRGFTLVEMVIYVALAVLVLGLIIELALVGLRSFARAREERVVTMDAASGLERMVREIRLASNLNLATSVLNMHPGRLSLNSLDQTGQPQVVEFFLADGILRIKEGVNDSPLTSGKTEITNLIFENSSDPKSQAVRVELSLRPRPSGGTVDFSTTAVLRGFYANAE